jgi:hypothetical protein
MMRLIEAINWIPVHDASIRYDDSGDLVFRDGTMQDWHLLRWTDARLKNKRLRVHLTALPCSSCDTNIYIHRWGNKDVCSITQTGEIVIDEHAIDVKVERLPSGPLSIIVIFDNFHPTLSIGTGNPRGVYAGSGQDQYVIKSIDIEIFSINPTKEKLVANLWRGRDPFSNFPAHLFEFDLQGWGSQHSYLKDTITELRPSIVVEVGVWKGAATVFMANELKRNRLPGVVIAVDTWLGAADHWTSNWFDDLNFVNGYPTLFYKFMCNIVRSDVTEHVLPLPLDSLNAAHTLRGFDVRPQIIHIDAGHDYGSVMADLRAWWPLLEPGGALIGDDYSLEGYWPGVRRAFDEFFTAMGLMPIETLNGKCRIRKPNS